MKLSHAIVFGTLLGLLGAAMGLASPLSARAFGPQADPLAALALENIATQPHLMAYPGISLAIPWQSTGTWQW